MTRMLRRLLCLLLFVYPFSVYSLDMTDAVRKQIQQRVEILRSGSGLELQGQAVASVIVLPRLYEDSGFSPLWGGSDSVDQLFAELRIINADGLNADDYHYPLLVQLRETLNERDDPALQADIDMLMTDSLIRMGYHLLVGKVDPVELDSDWNMQDTIGDLNTVLELAKAIGAGQVSPLVAHLRPQHEVYEGLRKALARYRRIRDDGGWSPVPTGPTLKPGMNDERVPALRARLVASGDMPAENRDSPLFDTTLEQGVKAFQARQNLEVDGKVGKGTLAAMNVPVQARIDQIRVNLERARWVLHDLPEDFMLADIAGFRVSYFRGGVPAWEARSQVGKAYRKTPVFRSQIRYLVMNPTWTVPPTILEQDILPKLKQDPAYLEKKNMRVIDHQGNTVDASTLDWKKYTGRNFPYMIRQDPGPNNALGQIKFIFPNDHAVYLHDTNHRDLFGRSERAFSSGCIRIEEPFQLAEILLDDPEKWSPEQIMAAVDSRQLQNVNLPRPVTIILMYWTAYMGADGKVHFRKDIYDRDPPVLDKLNDRFHFRRKPVISS
jgi:murein L,D-transpeptidase YcbB/YkuD